MEQKIIRGLLDLVQHSDVQAGKTPYIEDIREKALNLKSHFCEEYPEHLLWKQHPGEETWMHDYRRERWQPVTITATGRVYTSLQKIQQADDFKIVFKDQSQKNTGIVEDRSLQKYLTVGLPKFDSLETWIFQPFLKQYLKDANAIVFVGPDIWPWIDSQGAEGIDFNNPYPQIFESCDIVHKEQYGVVIKLKNISDGSQERMRFLSITSTGFVLLIQNGNATEGDRFDAIVYDHVFQKFPVKTVGSVISDIKDGDVVYDSILAPCLPAWNEALYRNDDLIVNWALHGNPMFWQLKTTPCKTCKGTGKEYRANGEYTGNVCGTCHGEGVAEGSPFGRISVSIQKENATNPSVSQPPIPPAGYVTRDVESLDKQIEDLERQIVRGYSAIGLDLLSTVPAAQSGIAKQYDRKEINTLFYQVEVHLVDFYYWVGEMIYLQRYASERTIIDPETRLPYINDEKAKAALPEIRLATDFDVLTVDVIVDNISKARKDNFSPILTYGFEYDLQVKLYGENSYQAKVLKALTRFDPLPFKTVDEKLVEKDSGGCSELDYILSTYLTSFVYQLIEEQKEWLDKEPKDQRADLKKMAADKKAEITAGLRVLMPQATGLRIEA